jgi:hypothetical protein
MSETDIQTAILGALGLFRGLKLWRNNRGGIRRRGHYYKFGLTEGASDVVGILHGSGRWFALEVKKPGEFPTTEQEEFIRTIQQYGGFACSVVSVSEAIAALKRALEGENE